MRAGARPFCLYGASLCVVVLNRAEQRERPRERRVREQGSLDGLKRLENGLAVVHSRAVTVAGGLATRRPVAFVYCCVEQTLGSGSAAVALSAIGGHEEQRCSLAPFLLLREKCMDVEGMEEALSRRS